MCLLVNIIHKAWGHSGIKAEGSCSSSSQEKCLFGCKLPEGIQGVLFMPTASCAWVISVFMQKITEMVLKLLFFFIWLKILKSWVLNWRLWKGWMNFSLSHWRSQQTYYWVLGIYNIQNWSPTNKDELFGHQNSTRQSSCTVKLM